MKRILAIVVVAVIAAGCGDPSGGPGSAEPAGGSDPAGGAKPAGSLDGAWGLTSGHDAEGEVPLVGGAPITLVIEGDNVNGTAACNHYGGDVVIEGSTFDMKGGTMTEMGCDPAISESQDRYMAALMVVDTISRNGDSLSLTGPDAELSFEFLPPPPTASLVDTTWRLEGLIEGRGPEGTVTSVEPAELFLAGNGDFRGSTGCRELSGEWVESGNTITFPTFSADGNCPPELEDQNSHVMNVLEAFTVEIDGRTLTIWAARGEDKGLLYNAD